jgi:protein-S-isoprenylcysteine O-methyltransferase Ste14
MGDLRTIAHVAAGWSAFALLHSATVSAPWQRWLRRKLGDARFGAFHRLGYTVVSVVTLSLLLLHLRSLPDRILFSLFPPLRWLFRLLQGAGLLFLLRTPVRLPEFLGIRQAAAYLRSGGAAPPEDPPRLCTGKSYGIVRHPLYLGCIAVIAFQPDQTVVSSASSVAAILYFWIGTFHEESRLVEAFGDEYREYRRRVPRLLPRPFRGRK